MKSSSAFFFFFFFLFVATAQAQNTMKLQPTPCVNWQANKAAFETAKAQWAAQQQQQQQQPPACYDYSYTFRGFQVGLPEPTSVQVRNGMVVNGANKKTLTDFFDMIESNCVADCPTKGAQTCKNEYAADTGVPTSVYISMSQYMADGQLTYSISDYVVVDCNEEEKQDQATEEEDIGQVEGDESNIRDSKESTTNGEEKDETPAGGGEDDSTSSTTGGDEPDQDESEKNNNNDVPPPSRESVANRDETNNIGSDTSSTVDDVTAKANPEAVEQQDESKTPKSAAARTSSRCLILCAMFSLVSLSIFR